MQMDRFLSHQEPSEICNSALENLTAVILQ